MSKRTVLYLALAVAAFATWKIWDNQRKGDAAMAALRYVNKNPGMLI